MIGPGFALGVGVIEFWQRIWRVAAAFAAGVLLTLPLAYCSGVNDGVAKEKAAVTKRENAALKRDAGAKEKAAAERVTDTADIAKHEKELTDADDGVADSRPSDARLAFNCRRLRDDQRRASAACRGLEARTQASARPGSPR